MMDTGFVSVVPAVTVRGEVTVALLAGLQMVTDGEAEFKVQGEVPELPAVM